MYKYIVCPYKRKHNFSINKKQVDKAQMPHFQYIKSHRSRVPESSRLVIELDRDIMHIITIAKFQINLTGAVEVREWTSYWM